MPSQFADIKDAAAPLFVKIAAMLGHARRTHQKPLENINFYVQLFVNNPQYLVFIRTSILYILREQDT